MNAPSSLTPGLPVDLRSLPPPEPMLAIMDALEQALPACGYWAFLLPRFPHPLLSTLQERGLDYRVEPEENFEGVVLRIAPAFPDDDA